MSRRRVILVLTFGLFLICLWFMIREANRVRSQELSSWKEDAKADCAVVLTGGPNRLSEGLDLLAQGQVKKLIISGVHPQSRFEEIFPNAYYYGTVAKDDVVLERRSQTTFGNAEQSLSIVEALNCRNIMLVTSYLHMYRAYKTFKASFPAEIEIYPRATIGMGYPPSRVNLFVESAKSLFYSVWAYDTRR